MKKLATIVLAAVAAVLLGASAAQPVSALVTAPSGTHTSSERRCTSYKIHWDTGVNYSILGFHDYAEAHFTQNVPARCNWFKTQILCLNATANNFYTKTSTVYRGVGVNDKLACDLDDPGERFSIDVNGHWRELCTSGGNPKCNWGMRAARVRSGHGTA